MINIQLFDVFMGDTQCLISTNPLLEWEMFLEFS